MKTTKKKVIKKKSLKEKTTKKKKPLHKKKILKKVHKRTKKIQKKNLEKRVSTGIPNFDKMIEKGFERNSINIIAGGSGSGKSIFAIQFLLEGIKRGEKVLYVTFEEKKQEFYENVKKFGWNLEELEKSGKFTFLEYSPEKVKMMIDEGGGSIESVILKNEIKRMVIDSITSFSLLFEDDFSKRQGLLGLLDIIRKWECTTLFTVQYDPSDKEDEEISSIEFEADSIILLYYVNIKNSRKRLIEVLKMRGTNHSKEIHFFEIGKKGIKIGKKSTIRRRILQG